MEYIELQIMGYYRVWGYILHPHTPSPPSKPHPLLSLYLTASTAAVLQKKGNVSWSLSTVTVYFEPPRDGAFNVNYSFPFGKPSQENDM